MIVRVDGQPMWKIGHEADGRVWAWFLGRGQVGYLHRDGTIHDSCLGGGYFGSREEVDEAIAKHAQLATK